MDIVPAFGKTSTRPDQAHSLVFVGTSRIGLTWRPQWDSMGMGLAICRGIVEAHGGRVWATANSDFGTIVRFAIPAVATEAPERTVSKGLRRR